MIYLLQAPEPRSVLCLNHLAFAVDHAFVDKKSDHETTISEVPSYNLLNSSAEATYDTHPLPFTLLHPRPKFEA